VDTNTAIILALVALVVVLGAVLLLQRRRSQQMRARYGAEYIAAVDEAGGPRKAEAELRRREKRVESFDIRPLRREEAEQFAGRWRQVQADFVDAPGAAIARADELLGEVMRARGYPVSDFEQRAADLSVSHPKLVSDYRLAHVVAEQHAAGRADTEDLRRAMIHYRDLFEELLAPSADGRRPAEPRAFSREEPEDERAARIRDEEERRADDRAAREHRRPGPRDGRAPRP
jgi:hypothetical protein